LELALLNKLFGTEARWQPACTILIDAEAGITTLGADTIGAAAMKSYAPRLVSGRIVADTACLLADGSALLLVQQCRVRQPSGDEVVRQTLMIVDPKHIVAVEFPDMGALSHLGISAPSIRPGSHTGTVLRPGYDRT
jgi:hypothetical protein